MLSAGSPSNGAPMASPTARPSRHPANCSRVGRHCMAAPGDFFVDTTCIDCDTCRQVAPAVFAEGDGHAFVHRQPATAADRRQALRALVCCPTGSIGCLADDRPAAVLDDFPLPVEEP